MAEEYTLQIFIDGVWRDAAGVTLVGDEALGISARTFFAYDGDFVLDYFRRRDAAALSVNHAVDLLVVAVPTWPAFLIDLLPQGYGRKELLSQLGRDENAGPSADWALLGTGAANPIGNMRVKQAHTWVASKTAGPGRGFTMDEIAERAGDFNEYLAQRGLFLAGSSGIQGEWPKILLTRARDGLLYLDHALPDEQAEQHFIVKFGRGADPALANILRCEAPYMQLARTLGLRVHADLQWRERALFIPRFDRQVIAGQLMRHAQESLASVCELGKFGEVPHHNEFVSRMKSVMTESEPEIIEYVKRDIANVVLGNTDNHARNTAILRRGDGHISLTPLFDFAPMFMHPDGIARCMRWAADDGGSPQWASVIAQAAAAGDISAAQLRAKIKEMIAPLSALMDVAYMLGIGALIESRRTAITSTLDQLSKL